MKKTQINEILEALNATLTKWENTARTDGNTEFNEGVCCGLIIAIKKINLLEHLNEVD